MVLLIFTCMCVKLWYLWRTQCEKVVGEDGNTNEDFASIMKGIMEKLTKERKDMKIGNASLKGWLILSTNLKVRISSNFSIHTIMRCFKGVQSSQANRSALIMCW